MKNVTFFLVGVLLVSVLFSLTGCAVAPEQRKPADQPVKTSALTREVVHDLAMERTRRKFERDHIEHERWVKCVSQNGYNSEGC